ncbi:MAG: hypothetical protein JW882_03340 [Deltaproteobacteria bacterium]|nr:hypothetical protein [Deltaproteobacteria bacterium]
MTEKNSPETPHQMLVYPHPPDQPEDEISLIDLIYPVYKRRLFLIAFCIIVTLLTAFLTLKSTKIYEATAVILPETPAEGGGVGSELKAAFLEQFGVAGLGGSSGAPSEIFEAVLKSNVLAREALLRANYFYTMGIGYKGLDNAVKSFADAVTISKDTKNPTLSIAIKSSDPVQAADLVNTYILELDKYNRTNMMTSTQRLRKYIEQRLETANQELDQGQQELREFQEKNRAISISDQAEATIEVLSAMEAERVKLEVEKAAMEKFYKGPHIEIEQINAQMEAIQRNINKLTYSDRDKVAVEHTEGDVNFYIPLNRIPALNFEESKLLLKVKAKTGVITMLITQLEQAKLDETRDLPTINILDWARAPDRPVKPRLKLNIILGFVVSIFLGIFLIFLTEFFNRMDQDPEASPKWREMKQGFRKMIPFSRKA